MDKIQIFKIMDYAQTAEKITITTIDNKWIKILIKRMPTAHQITISATDSPKITLSGTPAIDFYSEGIIVAPETDNQQKLTWPQIATIVFKYPNGKSISIGL